MEHKFSQFRESDKSLKHKLESIKRVPEVASWSLMQEVTGSNPFTVITNRICFCHRIC